VPIITRVQGGLLDTGVTPVICVIISEETQVVSMLGEELQALQMFLLMVIWIYKVELVSKRMFILT
jgi:hypothetical protein